MIWKTVIFILYSAFVLSNGMKSNEFCYQREKECYGSYSSDQEYSVKCETVKCNGKHIMTCIPGVCGVRKEVCDKFEYTVNFFDSIFKSIKYMNEKVKFKERESFFKRN